MFNWTPLAAWLAQPASPSETRRIEAALATIRAIVAVFCLAVLWITRPGSASSVLPAAAVFLPYAVLSVVVLVWVRGRGTLGPVVLLCVHGLTVACLISAFFVAVTDHGSGIPVLLISVFVLLAAAYRWGMRETVATAAVCGVLLFGVLSLTIGPRALGAFRLHQEFDVKNLLALAACLLLVSAVFGYLAESRKQSRAEAAAIAQTLECTWCQETLRDRVEATLDSILRTFLAERVAVALDEPEGRRAYLWEAGRRENGQGNEFREAQIFSFQRDRYFFEAPGSAWWATRRNRRQREPFHLMVLDFEGKRLPDVRCSFPAECVAWQAGHSLVAVSFVLGKEWKGKLFLYDPRCHAPNESALRFLRTLVQKAALAVYTAHLQYMKARHSDQAAVSRQLHDGVIQSLVVAEMEIDFLRRQIARSPEDTNDILQGVQRTLRERVREVREFIEQIKPLDVAPVQLPKCLGDLMRRFERDTGISARLDCLPADLLLPGSVSGEIVRIVQEALVNVRKHSAAHSVVVRLAEEPGQCKLAVEDDGKGFGFAGRREQSELDATWSGPTVIKERVRAMGGELAIESIPGHGARLEISLPRSAYE